MSHTNKNDKIGDGSSSNIDHFSKFIYKGQNIQTGEFEETYDEVPLSLVVKKQTCDNKKIDKIKPDHNIIYEINEYKTKQIQNKACESYKTIDSFNLLHEKAAETDNGKWELKDKQTEKVNEITRQTYLSTNDSNQDTNELNQSKIGINHSKNIGNPIKNAENFSKKEGIPINNEENKNENISNNNNKKMKENVSKQTNKNQNTKIVNTLVPKIDDNAIKRERSDSIEEIKPYDPFEGVNAFDVFIKSENTEIKYESDTECENKKKEMAHGGTEDKKGIIEFNQYGKEYSLDVDFDEDYHPTDECENKKKEMAHGGTEDKKYGKEYSLDVDFDEDYHPTDHLQLLLEQKYEETPENSNQVKATRSSTREYLKNLKPKDPSTKKKKKKKKLAKCKHCDKRLPPAKLKSHVLLNHDSGEQHHPCNVCPASFDTWAELKTHAEDEHKRETETLKWRKQKGRQKKKKKAPKEETFCDICRLDFDSNHYYALHNLRVHNIFRKDLEFPCQHCEMSYANKNSLRVHMIRKHEPKVLVNVSCQYCDKTYNNKNSLSVHIKRNHSDPTSHLYKEVKCNFCANKFNTILNLKYHMSRVHRIDPPEFVHKCASCELSFDSEDYLNFHGAQKHMVAPDGRDSYKCLMCGEAYGDKGAYLSHVEQAHRDQSLECESQETYECDMCKKTYINKDSFRRHVKTMHNRSSDTEVSEGGSKDCFQCYQCKAIYMNQHSLLRHLKAVHGEKTDSFQCDICNKFFTTNKNLLRHKNDLHSGEVYSCDICNHSFHSRNSWKVHMRRHMERLGYLEKSESENPNNSKIRYGDKLKCPECGKLFVTTACSAWDKLKIHMRKHAPVVKPEKMEAEPIMCQHCGETFGRAAFTRHVWLKHRETKTGPYKCDHCDFETFRKEGLVKHVQTHARTVLFRCTHENCDYKSAWGRRYKKHLQKHDPELSCEFCKFKTKNRDTLINHVLEHSTGEKRFKCASCTFETNSEDGYKKHLAKHEPAKLQCKLCEHKAVSYFLLYKHLKLVHKRTSAKL